MYCNIESHAPREHCMTFLDEAPLDFFLSKDKNSSPTENLFERDTCVAARFDERVVGDVYGSALRSGLRALRHV
jgi:hypothetical protein